MKLSELRRMINNTHPTFFSVRTMECFGDTIANFDIRSCTIDNVDVWELFRKKPVKNNRHHSHYFRKDNFNEIIKLD